MTEGDQSPAPAETTLRAARQWFVRLRREDIEPSERTAFMNWLNAEPSHAAAFQAVQQLWTELDGIREPILARYPLTPSKQATSKQSQHISWTRWAVAACLAIIVATLGIHSRTWRESNAFAVAQASQVFAAPRGATREILLSDGSRVTLAPGSKLRATIDGRQRKTVLQRGEALFEIAHDPMHPFTVEAGTTQITVLGTVFDTRLTPHLTQVTVLSGRVQFASAQVQTLLLPGQRSRAENGQLSKPEAIDLNNLLGWRQGIQVFDREPLGDVLADLSRFDNRTLTLVDPDLAKIPVSGVFRQGALEDFLRALGESVPLLIQTTPDGYRLASVRH